MKYYLLDTNAVISILNTRDSAIFHHLQQYPTEVVYVSSIVIYALFYGAFKSHRLKENVAIIDNLQ